MKCRGKAQGPCCENPVPLFRLAMERTKWFGIAQRCSNSADEAEPFPPSESKISLNADLQRAVSKCMHSRYLSRQLGRGAPGMHQPLMDEPSQVLADVCQGEGKRTTAGVSIL